VLEVKIRPCSPGPYLARCAASASPTTDGRVKTRLLDAVLVGPNLVAPAFNGDELPIDSHLPTKKVDILYRVQGTGHYRYRFIDPLLPPYVAMEALAEGSYVLRSAR
jgi:hypothetical protein